MKNSIWIISLACLIVSAGCEVNGQVESTPPPAVVEVMTAQPTTELPISNPVPTNTLAPTNAPAPTTVEADILAATLNLRSGPSMLHGILNQYPQGTAVTLIGAAPGREWVKVNVKDGKTGWMSVQHLTIKGDLSSLVVLPITESLIIQGKVVDGSGKGVQGIDIGTTRLGGAERVRVDGKTDVSGLFYAYAPPEYQGTWLAGVVGVDCKSPIVDANCRYAGVFSPGEGIQVILPQTTEILFTYK